MGSLLTTAVFAIVHRDPWRDPPPVDRLGAGSGAATHGGSLNRSTLCVSEKTCDESNHETEPLEDIRCLLMYENVTLRGFPFGDGSSLGRVPTGTSRSSAKPNPRSEGLRRRGGGGRSEEH